MKPHGPPQSVPVLTEVVVMPAPAPEADEEYPPLVPDPAYADTAVTPFDEWASPAPELPAAMPPEPVDEALLTRRVLADIDKQLDLVFEHRLRETLAPVLTRLTDSLVREMRNQLASSLREMVARAVSLELDRLHRR